MRHSGTVIVLGVGLAVGAATILAGGLVGWDPVVTAGLAVVLVVAVSGWLPLRPKPTPRSDSHEEHGCSCCATPAHAKAHARAASRSPSTH